ITDKAIDTVGSVGARQNIFLTNHSGKTAYHHGIQRLQRTSPKLSTEPCTVSVRTITRQPFFNTDTVCTRTNMNHQIITIQTERQVRLFYAINKAQGFRALRIEPVRGRAIVVTNLVLTIPHPEDISAIAAAAYQYIISLTTIHNHHVTSIPAVHTVAGKQRVITRTTFQNIRAGSPP